MSVIQVAISNQAGMRVPSVSRIALAPGLSVEFTAANDAPTTLFLTEQMASILLPRPESDDVSLAPGEVRTFSISSDKPGRYCVVLQSPEFPRPNNIGCGSADSAVIFLMPGDGSDFPVGGDDPQQ